MPTKFWNWIKNPESPSEERELEINGSIAEESWWDDDITPQMFRDELLKGSGPVTLWINSPGGDVFAASQIYTMLIDYPGKVTVKIDGMAASAASVIAMAGDSVLMAPTAMMMIHNPATFAFGDHNDMAKAIELLNEVKESIINAYEKKTGLSRAKIAHLMENETWMNVNKAIELGFADGTIEANPDKATNVSNITAFAFSGRELAQKLLNKISAKEPTVTPVAEEPKGRKVADLLANLESIKKI